VRTVPANNSGRGNRSPVSYSDTAATRFADQLQHCAEQNVLAIRRNPETGERTLDALRWGLIPNWAKDEKVAYKTINARVEPVDTAPRRKLTPQT